jgi:protein O-mannosyl-transferase
MRPALYWRTIYVASALAAIAVVALAAYSNSFAVPFVYDDRGNIVGNNALETFDFFSLSNYRGLRALPQATLALNVQLGGLGRVWHFHAVNLAIHIVNGWLVFWLVLALSRFIIFSSRAADENSDSPIPENQRGEGRARGKVSLLEHLRPSFASPGYFVPLLVALIFVAHPIATEAVTYIVQRTVSLTTMFYLLAVVSFVRWRTVRSALVQAHGTSPPYTQARALDGWTRHGWAALSLAATVLAMHSKQIAVSIPLMICWVEFIFFSAGFKQFVRQLPKLVPWLLLLGYIPWLVFGSLPKGAMDISTIATSGANVLYEPTDVTAIGGEPLSASEYFFTQLGVLPTYLQLLVLPFGQSIDHGYTEYFSLFNGRVLAGLLLALGAALSAWRSWPSRRLLTFGLGWFFITMLLESSVFPLLEVVAEYRLYLPSIGFAMMATGGLAFLYTKVERRNLVLGGAAMVIVGLVFLTWQRNVIWQNPVALWEDAIAKAPEKARAYNNLGTVLLEQDDDARAADQFARATQLEPAYAHAHHNLGTVWARLGKPAAAIAAYERALELDPDLTSSAINAGTIYLVQGDLPTAEKILLGALARDANSARAHTVLGAVYIQLNRLDEAGDHLERALAIDPDYTSARNNLELVQKLKFSK